MKLKFDVTIKCRVMNEMSLYERLRNAIFEWQTTEDNVKSVEVLPAPTHTKERNPYLTTNGYKASRQAQIKCLSCAHTEKSCLNRDLLKTFIKCDWYEPNI